MEAPRSDLAKALARILYGICTGKCPEQRDSMRKTDFETAPNLLRVAIPRTEIRDAMSRIGSREAIAAVYDAVTTVMQAVNRARWGDRLPSAPSLTDPGDIG